MDKKYIKILQQLRAGKPVSKDDIKYFIGYSSEVDEDVLQDLKDKEFKDLSKDEIQTLIDESNKLLLTNDQYKTQTLELAQEAEQGKVADKVRTGLNLLLAGADIASSSKQISESNKQLRRLRRPNRPIVPGEDRLLEQALNQAQMGTFDQSQALAPAQLQIQDQYLSDLNAAKVASTGQAGQFGALAQVAADRRNRAAMDLIPMANQIKQQEQARYDDLLGMKMQQTQNNFNNQAQLYPYDLQQYTLDQQAYGSLGATGRSNLRNSMANFGSMIPQVAGQLATNRKYKDIYNQMSAYGDDNAKIAAEASMELDSRFGNLSADDTPLYWEQAYNTF